MDETSDKVDLLDLRKTLDDLDPFTPLRAELHEHAAEAHLWAGIPMPLDDLRLTVEPRYPLAQEFKRANKLRDEAEELEGPVDPRRLYHVRNVFWSWRYRCDVVVMQNTVDDRISYELEPRTHHLDMILRTLGASRAWGIAQEAKAMALLGEKLTHHAFKCYLLTGTFLETSARSKVTYVFRRLRPTLALIPDRSDMMRILCALCMHPIAYYQSSWAGAMCPTDDVLAHLMMMRGDEPMLWRRCSQHPSWRPEAGI